VASGYVIAYIGLYPDQPLTMYAWKASATIGTTQINVRTTDPNFQIGAYYYVTIQAT
jgi:hypothetical protein